MTILQQGEQLLYWRWCGQSQPVSGQPIHAETPLRVYSMTKPVTVLSALVLEEQGLLDLEAPVENWIPELGGARALTQPNAPLEDCIELTHGPSLKQLMTHISGYSYNSEWIFSRSGTAQETRRKTESQPTAFSFGGTPPGVQPRNRMALWTGNRCPRNGVDAGDRQGSGDTDERTNL